MALIKWDHTLALDVAEIDNQHHRLVDMINALHDAMRQGRGKDVLGKIIDGLISYTATHFRTEERYFEKFGFPETHKHVSEHRAFVRKAADFQGAYTDGKLGLSTDVINFLSDWLKDHIQGSDRKYVPLFKERGLK
jgi:hemerythrin